MDALPLVKIPGLLMATVGFQVAYTSPNARPPPHTYPTVSSPVERLMKSTESIAVYFPDMIKACLWCSALTESAVIFANAYPSLPISRIILENLFWGVDASRIRFTMAAAAGISLAVVGGALRAWCYHEMGKFFTFEMSILKDHQLVTTGPYAIVRHPGYTAALMMSTAIFLLYATKGSWVQESGFLNHLFSKIFVGVFGFVMITVPLALFRRMRTEDRALREQFGEKWDAWAAKVPYMIIPGIW